MGEWCYIQNGRQPGPVPWSHLQPGQSPPLDTVAEIRRTRIVSVRLRHAPLLLSEMQDGPSGCRRTSRGHGRVPSVQVPDEGSSHQYDTTVAPLEAGRRRPGRVVLQPERSADRAGALAQLRHLAASGQLRPTDMVWKDGMPAWAAVDSIQNLCPARPAVSSPPPCPPSPVTGSPPQAIPKHKAKSNVSILGRLTGTLSKLVELANTVREGYGWAVAAVVGSSALLPVIGDFFRPIAPFNFLIFLTCSLVALSLLILFVKRPKTLNYPLGGMCAVCIVVALGFGFWWGLAMATGGGDKGLPR